MVLNYETHSSEMCRRLEIILSLESTPLRGYFLGVLTHTTAWDRLWGGNVALRLYILSSASPRLALQHESKYFYVTLEVYLTTLFSKVFCFNDFFGGTGRDGTDGTDKQTDKQTDRHTDRQTFLGKYYFRL